MNERLKWFVERAFGSPVVVLLLVACVGLAGVAVASVSVPVGVSYPDLEPTDSQPWVVEAPFFEWDYLVQQFINGSWYAVNGSNGDCFVVNGNESYVVDMCLGNVSGTGWFKVLLRGDFTTDSSLVVRSYTDVELVGSVVCSANVDVLRNSDQTDGNDFIRVHGGVWNGSGVDTANADIFEFVAGGSAYCDYISVFDVKVDDAPDCSFHFERCLKSDIHGVDGAGSLAVGMGVYWNIVADSVMYDVDVQSWDANFAFYYCSSNRIGSLYAGGSSNDNTYSGQVVLLDSANNLFGELIVDSSQDNGLVLAGTDTTGNLFSVVRVSRPVTADDTAVLFDSSSKNVVSCLYVGQKDESDNTLFNWTVGVGEASTYSAPNYNVVVGGWFQNCTSATNLVGAGSKVCDVSAEGVWVDD